MILTFQKSATKCISCSNLQTDTTMFDMLIMCVINLLPSVHTQITGWTQPLQCVINLLPSVHTQITGWTLPLQWMERRWWYPRENPFPCPSTTTAASPRVSIWSTRRASVEYAIYSSSSSKPIALTPPLDPPLSPFSSFPVALFYY